VVELNDIMGLQIDNLNFAIGNVENDDFLLRDHSEEVYDVFVLTLPED